MSYPPTLYPTLPYPIFPSPLTVPGVHRAVGAAEEGGVAAHSPRQQQTGRAGETSPPLSFPFPVLPCPFPFPVLPSPFSFRIVSCSLPCGALTCRGVLLLQERILYGGRFRSSSDEEFSSAPGTECLHVYRPITPSPSPSFHPFHPHASEDGAEGAASNILEFEEA